MGLGHLRGHPVVELQHARGQTDGRKLHDAPGSVRLSARQIGGIQSSASLGLREYAQTS